MTLEAIPADSSWYFERWEGDLTSSNNPATFIIEDHSDIQAVFRNEVTDIDGNIYPVVRIGNQTWLAENLRTSKYKNGDALDLATSKSIWAERNSYYYSDLDSENFEEFGAIYHIVVIEDQRGLCPNGWGYPTQSDYQYLIDFVSNISSLLEDNPAYWNSTGYLDNSGFKLRGAGNIWDVLGSGELDAREFKNAAYMATNGGRDIIVKINSNLSWQVQDLDNYNQNGYSVRCLKK